MRTNPRATKFDVLSYGTVGMDVIIRVPHWPHPDVSTHALRVAEHLGGKATNTATHLARWGMSAAVSGTVIGDDAAGRKLIEMLGKIPRLHVDFLEQRGGLDSMTCLILVDPQGERAIVGINADHHPFTQPTEEMIGSARVLTLDLYGGDDRIKAAQMAFRAGKPVIVGDLRDADHPVLPFTTVAIASAAELQRDNTGFDVQEFARAVLDHGAQGLIITDGSRAVTVVEASGQVHQITPSSASVVDSTGAGDAFRAGVVYGAATGLTMVEGAKIGAAAGTLAVGRDGAATNPASWHEVKEAAERLSSGTT